VAQQISVNDLVVVYNLGTTGADAYSATNKNIARVSATPSESGSPIETTIPIDGTQFPLASGSNRFHVVAAAEQQVAYICSGGNLYRSVASAPTTVAACVVGGPIIAAHVNCSQTSFSYSGSDLARNALVSMVLSLQDSSGTETVTLQHEVHVSNTP
jgi:MSHA biogenesis protein MshO